MTHGIMKRFEHEYRRGQWAAYNEVLNWLNTLEEQKIDKKEIYKVVSAMRPDGY